MAAQPEVPPLKKKKKKKEKSTSTPKSLNLLRTCGNYLTALLVFAAERYHLKAGSEVSLVADSDSCDYLPCCRGVTSARPRSPRQRNYFWAIAVRLML